MSRKGPFCTGTLLLSSPLADLRRNLIAVGNNPFAQSQVETSVLERTCGCVLEINCRRKPFYS